MEKGFLSSTINNFWNISKCLNFNYEINFNPKFKKMDTKKLLGWALGLAALGVTVYVVSKTWKAGQK